MEQHRHTIPLEKPCRECALEKARKLSLDRILVALDGTSESERALPYAAMAARWLDAELTLFNVVHPGPPFHDYRPGQVRYPDALHDRAVMLATAYLREMTGRLQAAGVRARWGLASGDAAAMIVSRAAGGGYGLTVMTVRTRSPLRRQFQPRVLEDVWRQIATPVLFVLERRSSQDGAGILGPVEFIVPSGGGPTSSEALPVAAALAGASGARITLLAALVTRRRRQQETHPGDGGTGMLARMNEAASYLREDRIPVRMDTGPGIPAHSITARQNESPGSWVVMASVMPSGLSRTVFGSTTDGVLRAAPGPVLVVPVPEVARKRAERARTLMQEPRLAG